MEIRPPLPHSHGKLPLEKSDWPKTAGIRAMLPRSRWHTPLTPSGATAQNSPTAGEAQAFLERKWSKELDYRLIKELWLHEGNRIAVRYAYEWHDDAGHWYRSYGNENWEFEADGLMRRRYACINDMPIKESERKFHWPLGRRPDDHPGLSDLGL